VTPTEKAELEREIARFKWFHQIDFGDGVLSPGWIRADKIERMVRAFFGGRSLAGKSVLDIGCWDGPYSIAASRLGASRVLATDHHVWAEGIGDRGAFELARARLAPEIEVMDISVDELSVERVGQFDIVLFAGVFYHLRDPIAALQRLAPIAREEFILESRLCGIPGQLTSKPLMRFYPGKELDGDPSNWWAPNPACMKALMRDVGFRDVQFSRPDRRFRRGIVHGTRALVDRRR
jgi:tRNA (mo5U34)-methyltransferase